MPSHFRRVYDYWHFYLHIGLERKISIIRYRYKGKAIIYIIRNTVTGMLYVGSTLSASLRFYHHFIARDVSKSNANLQHAIATDGIEAFNLYIMQEVVFPSGLDYNDKLNFLHGVEQRYMDKYPKDQLYNKVNSSS